MGEHPRLAAVCAIDMPMHNWKVSPYVRGAPPPINTLSPSAACLARLKAGNDRFLVGEPSPHSEIAPEPFAIVVGGAEVRVPIEKIFDAGPGELVVQRCMGSTAGRRGGTLFKSLEYAIVRFAPRLLLVLGESHSKIIGAALKQVSGASAPLAPMRAVLDQVMVSAMRAVTQMGKETAMTTAGREMKIRQLSVSRPIYYIHASSRSSSTPSTYYGYTYYGRSSSTPSTP